MYLLLRQPPAQQTDQNLAYEVESQLLNSSDGAWVRLNAMYRSGFQFRLQDLRATWELAQVSIAERRKKTRAKFHPMLNRANELLEGFVGKEEEHHRLSEEARRRKVGA